MSKTDRKLVGMIVEGRNLAPKDQNGLSDPFLTFGPIDKKGNWAFMEKRSKPLKSKISRKTLNPVWRSNFEIPIDSNCKAFRVEVWDWDMIGTDFMGQLVINISDLPKGRESENWYKLAPRNPKKDIVSGEVLVRIMYAQEATQLQLGGALSSVSKRFSDSSSSLPSMSGSSGHGISEDELTAMDDMRSGEIDLIMPALFQYAASTTCLQIGLPALAKWAATSSVTERIGFLSKYKETAFDLLVEVANQHKESPAIVFYALHAFGPFMRLLEAKPYFSNTIASLLATSMQNPPAGLSSEDSSRHCCNCLITLANVCTANLKEVKGEKETSKKETDKATEAVQKCEKIVVSSGALEVALSLMSNGAPNNPITKHVLVLLIKLFSSPTVKPIIQSSGFIAAVQTIISSWDDPVTLWLALDALSKYAAPSGNGSSAEGGLYLLDVVKMDNLFGNLCRIASLRISGLHGASIDTSIIYLLYTISAYLNKLPGYPFKTQEAQIVKNLPNSAPESYSSLIPKGEQKPMLPEKSLKLLSIFGNADPEYQKIYAGAFPLTAKFIIDFARFPSVLEEATQYIRTLGQWGVLSKEEATSHIQKALYVDEKNSAASKAIETFLAQL